MKTWNIPSLEELDVKLTASGENPSICEFEYDGCVDISIHKCCEYLLTGHCPHKDDGNVGGGSSDGDEDNFGS